MPQRLLTLAVASALLGAACSLSSLLPREKLEDEDYRFRLEQPNRRWEMMSEEEVQRIVPDASAGMMNEHAKLVAVVIVEQAPAEQLEPLVRSIVEGAPLEKKSVTHFDHVRFSDQDAIRYLMTGEINGVAYRYANTIFFSQDHLYQVITWGSVAGTEADGSSFEEVWRAFSLIDGPVRGRQVTRTVADTHGVGWRVSGGIFESAVYGLRLRPGGGWRVAIGAELDGINESAEVGLVRRAPQLTVLMIPERAPTEDRAAIEQNLVTQTAAGLGPPCPDKDVSAMIGDDNVRLRCFSGPGGEPFEYFYGLVYHELFAIQILAWLPTRLDADVARLLREALAAVELLDRPTRARLSTELGALPDPQNRVGSSYSLRRGIYQDFAHGLSWTKPEGFWRLRVGDEARTLEQAALLSVEHPATGIWGMLLQTAAPADGPEAYHQAVRGQLAGAATTATPRPQAAGAATALVSELRSTALDVPFVYRLATVVHGPRAYQLVLWGTPANVAAAGAELDAAIAGWSFTAAGLPMVTSTPGRYQDHRLGWSLTLPDKPWTFTDLTGDGVRALGSTVQWQHEEVTIMISSLCAVQEGQDERWYVDQLTRIYADHLGGALSDRAERREATIDGEPALHLRWRGRDSVDAYVTTRDKTIYALLISQGKLALDWPLEEILAGFHFSD